MPDPVKTPLPESLKGDQSLAGFAGVEDLAGAYVQLKSGDYRTLLPEDLRNEKSFEAIKDVPSLAKQYLESQKYNVGAIRMPKEDAKPEEWDLFYAKLGRPAKPEDYGIAKPKDMPPGLVWNDDLAKWFGSAAHKRGLSKTQVLGFMQDWQSHVAEQVQAEQRQAGDALAKLQQELGDRFDGYVELGARAVQRHGGEALSNLLKQYHLEDHPVMIKAFASVGRDMMEHGLVVGDGSGGALTTKNLQEKINQIRADKAHAFNNPKDPNHQKAVDEINALYDQLYPKGK